MQAREDITGLILAGGRGSRMGGVDKGLQNHRGVPLALHALLRLRPQVGQVMINANRNLGAYESFGAPVWPDPVDDFAGPLAGFLAGLEHCETPLMLTVPSGIPVRREMPWWKTSHGLRPMSARTITAIPTPNRMRPSTSFGRRGRTTPGDQRDVGSGTGASYRDRGRRLHRCEGASRRVGWCVTIATWS